VHAVQAADADSVLDRFNPEAEREQLAPRDIPVLARGEPSERPVDRV